MVSIVLEKKGSPMCNGRVHKALIKNYIHKERESIKSTKEIVAVVPIIEIVMRHSNDNQMNIDFNSTIETPTHDNLFLNILKLNI